VHFGGVAAPAAIVERGGLAASDGVAGPAIVEEATATTILPPGWRASIGPDGHKMIRRV
jgi:N-methylhydantoinase A